MSKTTWLKIKLKSFIDIYALSLGNPGGISIRYSQKASLPATADGDSIRCKTRSDTSQKLPTLLT